MDISPLLVNLAATGVVVVAVFVLVALGYVVWILKRIKDVLGVVRRETKLVSDDIDSLRANVKYEGFKIKHLFRFIRKIIKRRF